MIKKNILFIINPISGTQDKKWIYAAVDKFLNKEKFDHEIVETQYAGHGYALAQAAIKDKKDIVVTVGGDGTVNEIARALRHSDTALGIIPSGSGNGLARHLQLPSKKEKIFEIINQCQQIDLDYGMINEYPFFCTCGIGFDAFLSKKFAESGKRGPISYIENILKTGLQYEPETYEIEDDCGVRKYKAFLISCGNASQYGNNAYIAPQASMTDGLLDVTIMEPFGILEAPQISIDMFNKTLDKNSKIKSFKCRKLVVKRKKEGLIHFDGDPIVTGNTVTITIIPKGIKVIINPNADKSLREPNVLQEATASVFNEFNCFIDKLNEHTNQIQKIKKDIQKKLKI